MALTQKQQEAREGKLTASRVSALMAGDDTKLLRLWQEMIGDPSFVADDLSGVWPVRLGEATEALNLEWYERKHGKVTRAGEVVLMPDAPWACATLDGWDAHRGCAVECKNVGGREPLETIVARYQPQTHWQMLCTKSQECALSVIMGANEPIVEFLPFNSDYAAELMKRAVWFMGCVENLTPPVSIPAVVPPVAAVKTYDFSSSNSWAEFAGMWCANKEGAELFKRAEEEIKGMIPNDAAKCTGHNIVVSRNRAGSLTIKKE